MVVALFSPQALLELRPRPGSGGHYLRTGNDELNHGCTFRCAVGAAVLERLEPQGRERPRGGSQTRINGC